MMALQRFRLSEKDDSAFGACAAMVSTARLFISTSAAHGAPVQPFCGAEINTSTPVCSVLVGWAERGELRRASKLVWFRIWSERFKWTPLYPSCNRKEQSMSRYRNRRYARTCRLFSDKSVSQHRPKWYQYLTATALACLARLFLSGTHRGR
jgi:hypothetical protein